MYIIRIDELEKLLVQDENCSVQMENKLIAYVRFSNIKTKIQTRL